MRAGGANSVIGKRIGLTEKSISEYVALAHSGPYAAWLAPPRSGRRRISLEDGLAERLEKCFTRGSGHGLLQLGAGEAGTSLPLSLAWWRDFALRFVAVLCALGETAQADERRDFPAPAASDLTALIDKAPPMQGGEYLQLDVLIALWQSTERALEIELSESKLPLQDFLKARNSRWRLVGRVHFNLAENRRDQDYPFAFMATYTSGLSADGVLRHLPSYGNMPAPGTKPSYCSSWPPFNRRARPAPG